MTKKLEKVFALSERGAKDLIKSIIWTVICDLCLMLPIGVVMLTIYYLLESIPLGADTTEKIIPYTAVAVLVLIVLYIVHYIQYAALYLSVYLESANRRIAFAETLRKLPLSFFGKRDLSDLTATMITDCSNLDQMFSHYIPQSIASTISTVIIAVMMFCFDWRMSIAVLWVVPVSVALAVGSKKLQDKFGRRTIAAKRKTTDSIQECIETIKETKSCNRQSAYLDELEDTLRNHEKAQIRSELVVGSFISTAQAFLKLGIGTTVLVGSVLLIEGKLDILYFLGFLFVAVRVYDPIGLILQNIAATFNSKLQIERMRAIVEQPVQTGDENAEVDGYDIVFENVSFSYNDGEGVLENVSFTARQGEVTALVGPSGGGKSTATKLAARFWDTKEGKITLGGRDVSGIDPEALLSHYSIVFQDVVLFRDTVMENIRLGRHGASDEDVIAAARAAQCEDFIKRLPDGYQTMIGENGSTLSGGERQRISIARALLKDAPVILLDEATASLDVENESAVQSALSRLVRDKTVIIIAHRMRTVSNADKLIVLDEGKVVQEGSPAELISQEGPYRRMMELQQTSSTWTLG